ncbi:MAG: helix-turn-helix domain-containing protein [Marinilabiliaceae bacterium]|nr:helix-turn-helix domain-containing protein [Bacteroidales bacterium]MCR5696035.1 helix-turn-helix domain-containing protein [Marinilabiliaceae bacterium]
MLSTIDIAQIIKLKPFRHAVSFADYIVITDSLDIDIFRYPCRLNAVSVLLCKSGAIDCTINLKSFHIEANTIIICTNSDIVQIEATPNACVYAGLISTTLLDRMRINYWQSNAIISSHSNVFTNIPDADMHILESYYGMLRTNMTSGLREAEKIIENLVSAFAHTLISVLDKRIDTNYIAKTTRSESIHEHFMELLNQYHTTERSVTFYADKMCLTPNYLSAEVRNFSGKTALEWINEYVILEAKTLLRYSQLNIREVALRLNFPTQSAFGKYFKKYVGVGPKEYQK